MNSDAKARLAYDPTDFSAGDRLAVHVFTAKGLELARRIAAHMPADLYAPKTQADGADVHEFSSLQAHMLVVFRAYRRHVFIGATGIAVRAIAPLLRGKDVDPAVVVMDQCGKHAVSLIGGHMAGANRLALHMASLCGGEAVISTATDAEGLPAIDSLAVESGLAIADAGRIKNINAAFLRGERVSLSDPEQRLDLQGFDDFFSAAASPANADVRVSWQAVEPDDARLILHPPVLFAGVGCRRNTDAGDVVKAITDVFAQNGLALPSLAGIASVDIKAAEPGLINAAKNFGVPFAVYSAGRLGTSGGPSFSSKAWEILGIPGVAEPAALCMAAERGAAMLLVPKTRHGAVTVAVSRLGALWSSKKKLQ